VLADRTLLRTAITLNPRFGTYWPLLESYHDDVHVSIAGDLLDFATAPADPVFYNHHAFVDKQYSEWQGANGNEFGGVTREGQPLSLQSRMTPWNVTVQTVITDWTACVTYLPYTPQRGPSAAFAPVPEGARAPEPTPAGQKRDVAEATQAAAEDATATKLASTDEKRTYQRVIAQRKIEEPAVYRAAVTFSAQRLESSVASSSLLGATAEDIAILRASTEVLELTLGVNLKDYPAIESMSDEQIVVAGVNEVSVLETGQSPVAGDTDADVMQ
jgi:hypothetical protein